MSSSRLLLSPLFLLSLSLFLQLALALSPVYYFCGRTGNFTLNGPYNKNLNTLLSDLDSKTPLTGFSNGSVGSSQDQVTGLALCRGDINSSFCQSCVDQASTDIQTLCPSKKESIIWYEFCELKYSNISFLGQIDDHDWFYEENRVNASNPVKFNKKLIELLSKLDGEASASPKLFADGSLKIKKSTTIYALVQCTRDLSSADCKICLTAVTNVIPRYLYGKVGGKFWGGSCNVRFEIYPFFSV